jgi:hypothetical protein
LGRALGLDVTFVFECDPDLGQDRLARRTKAVEGNDPSIDAESADIREFAPCCSE